MPRNRKKKSATHQSSAQSEVLIPIGLPSAAATYCSNSSSTAIYPSVYRDGCVDRFGDIRDIFMNIVCQTEYGHLSPEVFHMCTAEFISRILRATYVGAALPGSGDRYGSCLLGSTFVRGGFQSSFSFFLSHVC